MATIKFGIGIADIRGKIGGTVFQRNKNGAFARTLHKPINSNTVYDQYWKANVSFYSKLWRQLTDEDRSSWAVAAIQFPQTNRVGDTVFLSGYQLYQKTNQNLEVAAYG